MYQQQQQQSRSQQQPVNSYAGGLVMPQGQPQPMQQGARQQGGGPQNPNSTQNFYTDMRYRGPAYERGKNPQQPQVDNMAGSINQGGANPPQMDQFHGGEPNPPQGANPPQNGVPQTYNVGQYQQWAQQRYGRQANQNELNQIAQHVGYQGQGDGITEDQWTRAQQYSDQLARQQGWNGPAQPTTPAWGQNQGTIDPVTGRMFGPQYQNPYQQQQQQVMNAILGSGGSMNQQVQDQMFEQQKEQALALNKQLGMQGRQNTAARGFGSGGAAAADVQNKLNSSLGQQLMGGRRDISAQAAQVNRQDQLNALQASQGLDQQAYGQFMGDRNASLQEWLAQRQNQLDNRRTTNQEEQFRRSLELEYQRFVESQRQFNQNFGENQRQFNGQMGFNYTNMNNNNNNSFLRYLMGG